MTFVAGISNDVSIPNKIVMNIKLHLNISWKQKHKMVQKFSEFFFFFVFWQATCVVVLCTILKRLSHSNHIICTLQWADDDCKVIFTLIEIKVFIHNVCIASQIVCLCRHACYGPKKIILFSLSNIAIMLVIDR